MFLVSYVDLCHYHFLNKSNQFTSLLLYTILRAPGGSDSKQSACNAGDPGSIPGSGRSPGEVNGNPLQYSCLENRMDIGAWWATVHGISARLWLQVGSPKRLRSDLNQTVSFPPTLFSSSVLRK